MLIIAGRDPLASRSAALRELDVRRPRRLAAAAAAARARADDTAASGDPRHFFCHLASPVLFVLTTTQGVNMTNQDFYQEKKWCSECQGYVRYLMSVNHSFCVDCGTQVSLFNKEDAAQFSDSLEKRKWKAS